jgi:hypothetical protein
LLNCNAVLQTADFTFAEWTITSDFLPEGQPVTAGKMQDLQERLDLTVVGAPRVYASDILGNAALERELTIARLDADGAEVILTYKQGSRMGAKVLNQRVIMLNVPKDVPVKSFKIIYPHSAAAQK